MSGKPAHWMEVPEEDPDVVEAANILYDMSEGRTPAPAPPPAAPTTTQDDEDEENSGDDEESEQDSNGGDGGDDSGTYQQPSTTAQAPSNPTTTTNTAATGAPASILDQGQVWKYQQPMAQPLGFRTASDAAGGERVMTYAHVVNFNSRDSVNEANKSRRREVWRARQRFGLARARENFLGNTFMPAHLDWIAIAHEAYAMLHGGRRIPWNILILWWNFCWGQERSEQTLRALESRNQEFRDMRRAYPQ